MADGLTWFGDPEVDAALRGESAPGFQVPVWAPQVGTQAYETPPALTVIDGDADQDGATSVTGSPLLPIRAPLPVVRQPIDRPDGVRPDHKTFGGAVVDPAVDAWAGQDNEVVYGSASMIRVGGQ